MSRELFQAARARWVTADLVAACGVALKRVGGRLRGACPLCGGDKTSGRFSLDPRTGAWTCWAGCGSGDVITLEQRLRGGTPKEAAERLAPPDLRPAADKMRPAADKMRPATDHVRRDLAEAKADQQRRTDRADRLASVAVRAEGTLVERYLRARGVPAGPVLARALAELRFVERGVFAQGRRADGAGWRLEAPLMLAAFRAPNGARVGVHATALAPDGLSKAQLRDPETGEAIAPKRMFGTAKGAAIRLSPWEDDSTPLLLAEGIETALSAAALLAQHLGLTPRVIAAGSLQALAGEAVRDRFGRLDPSSPRLDPDRAPFTLPNPGRVVIALDHDMSPITVRVRGPVGGTVERVLDASARARLAGDLAAQAWRAAGAAQVTLIAPRAGRDFNDELCDRAARRAVAL